MSDVKSIETRAIELLRASRRIDVTKTFKAALQSAWLEERDSLLAEVDTQLDTQRQFEDADREMRETSQRQAEAYAAHVLAIEAATKARLKREKLRWALRDPARHS